MGCVVEGLDGVVLPEIFLEEEGFVGFEGDGVEGACGDVLVVVEVATLEAEGGGVFVEVSARDFELEGELDT